MMQAFWQLSTLSHQKPQSNSSVSKKNRCIAAIREGLTNKISDVLIDIVINHTFAQYTLYGLSNATSHAPPPSESIAMQAFLSQAHQPRIYSYKTIQCFNTSNITIVNNHIFARDENNILYTSNKTHHFHKNLSYIQIKAGIDIKNIKMIPGAGSKHDFVICDKKNNNMYDQPHTYLYDNNTASFYSYDHHKNSLIKLQSNTFNPPSCKINEIVKCENNHNLIYYWCLMSNGILFKIVFDHNFFNGASHRHRRHSMFRNKSFISEHGPYEYHQAPTCGKHTLDLEVFRLVPQNIPRFKSMVTGGEHILFLDHNDRFWCYGDNGHGQCGIKKTTDTIVQPIQNQLFRNVRIKKIFAGDQRSMIIDRNGRCYIMGQGVESTMRRPYKLFQSFPGMEHKRIENGGCGNEHFIFVDDNGIVYGLGSNRFGQISDNLHVNEYTVPVIIERGYIGIASSSDNDNDNVNKSKHIQNENKIERIEKVIINGNKNYFLTTRNVIK